MTVKKSEIVFNKNISKEEYEKLFNEFSKNKGYLTKLMNKECNDILGYLVRAEIPGFKDFIAISFEPIFNNRPRFAKSIAINRVLTAGQRKLKRFMEESGDLNNFTSESILDSFDTPREYFESVPDDFVIDNYAEIYEYISAFENKIKTYYNDNSNIKIVVI
jgi:hypothetical protein